LSQHPSHTHLGIRAIDQQLHVLCTVENPQRSTNRYKAYWEFSKHVEDSGAILWTCEIAFGERTFEVTEAENPRHLRLRSSEEVMHKENGQNLLAMRLPLEAQYIAMIDADLRFQRANWVQETLHLLQHYPIIQMYSHIMDLGPSYKPLKSPWTQQGWVHAIVQAAPLRNVYGQRIAGKEWGTPGGAWAYRRSALNDVGGLLDWNIVGPGDWMMALGLYGRMEDCLRPAYTSGYKSMARAWQLLAETHIRGSVGYMEGLVVHSWHGDRSDRGYRYKPQFIADCQFDPITDLKRDTQGLWTLTGKNQRLGQGLKEIERLKNSDSQEVNSKALGYGYYYYYS
jgi:hypothetical protein